MIYRYAHALLTRIPMLAELIERETAEAIDLTNGVTVEIMAASFRSVRGYTLIAALCDEIAFWRSDDSANPDVEIIAALRPAIATIPSAMLLCASSPYAPWRAGGTHSAATSAALTQTEARHDASSPSIFAFGRGRCCAVDGADNAAPLAGGALKSFGLPHCHEISSLWAMRTMGFPKSKCVSSSLCNAPRIETAYKGGSH